MVNNRFQSSFRRFTFIVLIGISSIWIIFHFYMDKNYSNRIRDSFVYKIHFRRNNDSALHETVDFIPRNSLILDIPFNLPYFSVGSISPYFDFGPWSKYFLENKLPVKTSFLDNKNNETIYDDDRIATDNNNSLSTEELMISDSITIDYGKLLKVPLEWNHFTQLLPKKILPLLNETFLHDQLRMAFDSRICPNGTVFDLSQTLSLSDVDWCKWAITKAGVKVRIHTNLNINQLPSLISYVFHSTINHNFS